MKVSPLSNTDGIFDKDRNTIIINSNVSASSRYRFTFFHELTHFLIENSSSLLSNLHETYEGEDLEKYIEELCNVGASEWLIPYEDIKKYFSNHNFSIEYISNLCSIFCASGIAVALQMVTTVATHKCYLVIASRDSFGNLVVKYTAQSQSAKYKVGKNSIVSQKHLLTTAFDEKCFVAGQDLIPFKSKTQWKVDCEAIYYKGLVYSIFNVEKPNHSLSQLMLF